MSLAIKGLEADLGKALFRREHNRIALTEAGRRFYADVALALGYIARSVDAVRGLAEDRHVTLSSSTAFASHWMIPRLADFRALHPQIEIRLQTSDRDLNLKPDPLAIGIRRGLGEWPNYLAFLFADEILTPVRSPDYLHAHGVPPSPADLSRLTLIHLDEPHRPRPTWRDWFGHFGTEFDDNGEGLRLNDYSLVVQAAIGGQGVALGWEHIVDHALQEGLLVSACACRWATGHAFFVVHHAGVETSEEAIVVRNWILSGSRS